MDNLAMDVWVQERRNSVSRKTILWGVFPLDYQTVNSVEDLIIDISLTSGLQDFDRFDSVWDDQVEAEQRARDVIRTLVVHSARRKSNETKA